MNILHITNQLDIGGITSYVLTLGAGLKNKGHNVYVASSGGELLHKFIEQGIILIPVPIKTKSEVSPKVFLSLIKLVIAVKQNNIEIIHSHSRTTQVVGCLLARICGVAHVSTCHGFFKKRFSRRLFPCWGRKVIAISRQVKEHLMEDFNVKEDDIRVVHNGIDTARFTTQNVNRRQLREKFRFSEGPVIGIVARLSDVKGHIYLIEAMKHVLDKVPAAQLAIVGEGRMKEELCDRVRQLKLEKNILFIPSVADTKDMLSAMDLFVMPSLKEGLGLALMEAMAAGLPVIGSDVGGIKSLIQHQVTGLLVKPSDVEGLSSAIVEILQDSKKAAELGGNAKKFINENFSQEEMVLQTERMYLECVNAKNLS